MSQPIDDHQTDRLLARAHLRLGMLSFARAELERLAVAGALDAPALADLAEARWRTGDLAAAGQVAEAALEAGADETTVLVVAAEAAMADGRVSDAQRFADSALGRSPDLDALFAGQPRSRIWRGGVSEAPPVTPVGPSGSEAPEPEAEPDREATAADDDVAPTGDGAAAIEDESTAAAAAVEAAVAPAEEAQGSMEPMPAEGEPSAAEPSGPAEPAALDERPTALPTGPGSAHRLISFAAGALRDDRGRAATELAIVLRSEPSLAPAVLELLSRGPAPAMSRSAAALEIVRGDAFRLIGRPREAEEAYGRALAMLGELDGP